MFSPWLSWDGKPHGDYGADEKVAQEYIVPLPTGQHAIAKEMRMHRAEREEEKRRQGSLSRGRQRKQRRQRRQRRKDAKPRGQQMQQQRRQRKEEKIKQPDPRGGQPFKIRRRCLQVWESLGQLLRKPRGAGMFFTLGHTMPMKQFQKRLA